MMNTARLKEVATNLYVRSLSLPGVQWAIDSQTVSTDDLESMARERDAYWRYAPSRTLSFGRNEYDSDEFPKLAAKAGDHRLEEAFVAELRDVELVGDNAIGVLPNSRWLLENAGPSVNLLMRSVFSAFLSGTLPRRSGDDQSLREFDTAVSLVGPWCRGYFHWVSEWLPRLEGVDHYTDRTGREPVILLPRDPPDWMTESLRLVGFGDADWVEWDGGRAVVDRLVVPSVRRAHPVDDPGGGFTNSPEGFHWIRERALNRLNGERGPSFSSRVYVSRAGAQERRVTNEDAVVSALRERGFESYRLEELPFHEQVAMFADAEAVVGPHGAGLVNSIFGSKLTIVEMFGNYRNACYYTMAKGLGFEYEPLACEPVGPDLWVEVEELTELVDRVLEDPRSDTNES